MRLPQTFNVIPLSVRFHQDGWDFTSGLHRGLDDEDLLHDLRCSPECSEKDLGGGDDPDIAMIYGTAGWWIDTKEEAQSGNIHGMQPRLRRRGFKLTEYWIVHTGA